MTHAACADAGERKIAARLERNGVALPNFLHHDQRHFGEDLCILGFAKKFLVVRITARTSPSAAAACSSSIASQLRMALLIDSVLGLQRRKSRVRTSS